MRRLLELVLSSVSRAVALLSWEALARIGAWIGLLAGSVLRVRRAAVEAAMARAEIAEPRRQARAMYASLGAGLMELLWLGAASASRRERAVARYVALDAELEAAIFASAERGPVIFAASHTANWELVAFGAARVLAARGRALAVVVKPQSVGVFDAFCMRLRRASGLTLIRPAGAFDAAKRVLAGGGVVAMPIDKVPDRARHALRAPFLGAAAFVDRAPAVLARATGATLLIVAASRDGRTQRVHLLAELRAAPRRSAGASGRDETRGGAGAAWVAHAARASTRALDAFVRAHPESWLWLHRRWRAPLESGGGAAPRVSGESPGSLVVTGHPG